MSTGDVHSINADSMRLYGLLMSRRITNTGLIKIGEQAMISKRSFCRLCLSSLLLMPILAVAGGSGAQAAEAKLSGPGWTGLNHVDEIIAARHDLMIQIENLMVPVDTYTVANNVDPALVRKNAESVSKLLKVLPHLFPPTTNVYDPKASVPRTLARPELWKSFDAFYGMANATSESATAVSRAADTASLRKAALALRQNCMSCHAAFLPAYKPQTFNPSSSSDLNLGEFK